MPLMVTNKNSHMGYYFLELLGVESKSFQPLERTLDFQPRDHSWHF